MSMLSNRPNDLIPDMSQYDPIYIIAAISIVSDFSLIGTDVDIRNEGKLRRGYDYKKTTQRMFAEIYENLVFRDEIPLSSGGYDSIRSYHTESMICI